MGLMAKESGSKRALIPQGIHDAICFMCCDIGTQFNPTFGTSSRKIIVGWEFPDHRIQSEEYDKPMVNSMTLTLSLHEKALLRKFLESWKGCRFTPKELTEGFDISKLLGVNCQIQILHEEKNGKTYDNIANILPPKSGKLEKVKTENELIYFSLDDNMEIPENVYDWVVEKIKKSEEWSAGGEEEPEFMSDENEDPGPDYDDIPF